MKKSLSWLLLAAFPLCAGSLLDLELPFTDVEKGLPTITAGCVNVISGDYLEQVADVHLSTPVPLSFERFYSSADYSTRSLFCGWRHNHDCNIRVIKDGDDTYHAYSTEQSGRSAAYKGSLPKLEYQVDKRHTNCGAAIISAKNNIRNSHLTLSGKEITARQPNGNQHKLFLYRSHIFEHSSDYKPSLIDEIIDDIADRRTEIKSYIISNLKTPVGHQLQYSYDNEDHIKQISATDETGNTVFGALTFEKKEKDRQSGTYHVTGSNGAGVVYEYEAFNKLTLDEKYRNLDKRFHIIRAAPTNAPPIRYTYSNTVRDHEQHICERALPNNRYRRIGYYTYRDCERADRRTDRVKWISAPVGTTAKEVITHLFEYRIKEGTRVGVDGFVHKYQGCTDVLDTKGGRTTYEYDRHDRLTNVLKYEKRHYEKWVVNDNYVWDEQSRLVCHNVNDAEKTCASRRFLYDNDGNVISEKLFGNITRFRVEGVKLDARHLPEENGGSDCYAKHYTYTKDHLVETEKDDTGLKIEYQYYPKSELVKAKFVYDNDKIKIRYFFEYDPLYKTVTKLIKDNGRTKEKEDLTKVTERIIEETTPTRSAPYGLPHIVEEKFLNPATGKVELIKKSVIHYTPQGLVSQKDIYDSQNEKRYSLFWEYDAHGNVVVERNALGRATYREYDENDNLIKEEVEGGRYRKEFVYDFSDRLITEKIVAGKERFVTSYAYDFSGNRTVIHDLNGNTTSYRHDPFGRATKIIYPKIPDLNGTLTEPNENFSYDIFDAMTRHEDQSGEAVVKKNNILGQPLVAIYSDGSFESNFYNLKGKLIKKRERSGCEILYKYDFLGRLVEEGEKKYKYNAFHLLKETDEEGNTTNYEYDARGLLVAEKREGRLTTYEYDALGNKTHVKEWLDEKNYISTQKKYDFLGQLIEERVNDTTTTYAYDVDGNCCAINKGGAITKTRYDFQKRPTYIKDPMGNITRIAYQYGETDGYGQAVLHVITTAPSGHQTHVWKNALNHEAMIEVRDPFGELLSKKEMFYNGKGELLHVKESVLVQGKLEREIVYAWEYRQGQVTRQSEAVGSRDQKITTHRYNKMGQRVATAQPNGVTLFYEYDHEGRLAKLTSDNLAYLYQYDKRDLVVQVKNPISGEETKRKYDAFGQMIEERLSNGNLMRYEYDLLGRPARFISPDNSSVRYIYEALYLKQTERLAPDGAILYTQTIDQRDNQGRVVKTALPGKGGTLTYSYDQLSRLTEIAHPFWRQQVEGYDLSGNITGINQNTYEYDGLNQLTAENGHTYLYDSLNNRRQKDGKKHLINEHNQIVNDGERCYRYDLNGNLIDDGKRQYTYDALNRLVKVTKGDKEYEYAYDSFNRRTTKKVAGNLTHYLYMQESEVGSIDSKGKKEFRVLQTASSEIGATIAMEIDGRTYVALQDIQGNMSALLDPETGDLVESRAYTAFGEGEEGISPWGFAGKRRDPESGLINFGHRYYIPTLGRFLTPDPSGFADGSNLYAYTRNNPFSFVDHFGLHSSTIWDLFKTVALVLFEQIGVAASMDTGTGQLHAAPFTGPMNAFGPPRELSLTTTHEVGSRDRSSNLLMATNGIGNDEKDFQEHMNHLLRLSGGMPMTGVHHRTCFSEGMLDDFLRYIYYFTTGNLSNASREYLSTWRKHYNNHPEGRIMVSCHSEGAVHVRNALTYCPPEIRKQIDVVVIAGGAYIDKDLAGSVVHYCSTRDIVPYIDFFGRQKALTQGTVRMLEPAFGAPLFDHAFTSPTYERPLRYNLGRMHVS